MKKLKNIMWSVVLGLILGIGMRLLFAPGPEQVRDPLAVQMESESAKWFAREKNLTEFEADLLGGKVLAVGISVEYAFVNTDARYYVRIDTQRGLFLDLLKNKSLKKAPVVVGLGSVTPPVRMVDKLMGLLSPAYLSTVLMLSLVVLIFAQMGTFSNAAKSISESNKPEIRFKDVVGVAEAKDALQDIVAYLKNPKQFSDLGAKAPHGVILAGPPGTGKTLLAKAMAGEAGTSFISISGSDFTDKFFGVGVSKVKKLFEGARKQAPVVVFIDELDGLGKRSADASSAADSENNRIINALLVALDGFESNEGVVIVGATNYPERLDPALVRDGRFDRTVHLSLPTVKERETLFGLYVSKIKTNAPIDLGQLARLSSGLSPAAIANVVNLAAIEAGKTGAVAVTEDHLLEVLDRLRMGGAPSESGKAAMSEKERVRIAVHEAGHAIISKLTNAARVEKVSIIPRGSAGGVTLVSSDDQMLYTERELQAQMCMLLAGRSAEAIVLGSASTGASNDLERVTKLAYQMVTRYGFSRALGALSYAGLPANRLGETASPDVLAEVRETIRQVEVECAELLTANKVALDRLTKDLLEYETVSGAAVDACLGLRKGEQQVA